MERVNNAEIKTKKNKTHLAVPAAEPVAAHGIVGESTLLTAIGSSLSTLLKTREGLLNMSKHTLNSHK